MEEKLIFQGESCIYASAETEQKLKDSGILPEEAAKTILWAEQSNSKLLRSNGCMIAHLQYGTVTVWVEYEKNVSGYRLLNAYCHRIQIEEEPDNARQSE